MSLITADDIRQNRELSTSVKANKINQFIEDAQIVDLQELIGEKLYTDIVSDPSKTDDGSYPNLLDGGTYTYSGNTFTNPGLKAVLIDFAYARYRFFGNDTDGPFGVIEKRTQDGNNTSVARNREVYGSIRKVAFSKWCMVRDYLDRNSSSYTYWYGERGRIDDDQDLININKGTLR